MIDFTGKTIFITGAGAGIGRAAAILFAECGASVAAVDINETAAAETLELVKAAGSKGVALAGDVTQTQAVNELVERTINALGGIDCAFNNAGISLAEDSAFSIDAFDRTIAVNLRGVMNCMNAQIAHMLPRGKGVIVNTASIGGLVASPFYPAYTASKHGVIGLTRAAALAYIKQGVRINVIAPGATATEMIRKAMALGKEDSKTLLDLCPIGRMAEPREIAQGALWLCSDLSSFVVGHALVLDGGTTLQ